MSPPTHRSRIGPGPRDCPRETSRCDTPAGAAGTARPGVAKGRAGVPARARTRGRAPPRDPPRPRSRRRRGSRRAPERHRPLRRARAPPPRPRRWSAFFLVGARRQVVPHLPQLRVKLVLDQAAEELDGRALRADDLVADHARDDLVVTEPPDGDALVPFDQPLRDLVQLLEVAPAYVQLDEGQSLLTTQRVERLPERRRHAADVAETGRVEAAAVSEDLPDRLVLPRR